MSETIVEVKNLTKRFGPPAGGFLAVDNISFGIKKGEIVGLLGPNGAGKTTTIYLLLGLLTPTSGEIRYFGKDLQHKRGEIMTRVNFSSSYTDLIWRLSVFHNLDIIGRLYGIKDREKRIDELLNKFEIYKYKHEKTGNLSSGQKTRVMLVKAFLNSPNVLLLDEPTASLDPDIAGRIRQYILEERRKNNLSILFTSHNMAEVEEVCDRVIFIDHGKIIIEDTPSGLAKKVKLVKIQFMIEMDLMKADSFCKKNQIKSNIAGKYLNVDVKEENISALLSQFADNNIRYSEISIDKPNLEDYFLEVLKNDKRKNR